MRVLGVDPGSRYTGYGVLDYHPSGAEHVGHGVLCADAAQPLELRLRAMFEGLSDVVRQFRPDALAVEGVFTLKNARSALVLGHARGVVLLVAARESLPVHEYAPARVKKAIGAGGSADKQAVARMVSTFLKVSPTVRSDATDALAVAWCHLNRARLPVSGSSSKADHDFARRLAPAYRSFERSAKSEMKPE